MLRSLKFVQGAIAKKDFVPALTHFRIADGRVDGFNGILALSAPIDLDLVAMPKAVPFANAIERLPDAGNVVLNLTQAGRLSVRSGNTRFFVECFSEENFPQVVPDGAIYPLTGKILPILAKLAPFMGIDASRPWANGILLKNGSAFVTNNIVVIEYWLGGLTFPDPINLPDGAVKEMLRIGREPIAMQPEAGRITFHYDDTSWLSTQLGSVEWPDLARILDREQNAIPFPPGFFEGIERLEKFADKENRLYLRGGTLATASEDGVGGAVDLDDFGGIGCYFLKQLALLDGIATTMDFSMYPKPSLFFGHHLRGAIAGLQDAV